MFIACMSITKSLGVSEFIEVSKNCPSLCGPWSLFIQLMCKDFLERELLLLVQDQSKVWRHLLIQCFLALLVLLSTMWINTDDVETITHNTDGILWGTKQNLFYVLDSSK